MNESYRQARYKALVGIVETAYRLAQSCVDDGEPSDQAQLGRLEDVATLLDSVRCILGDEPS